MEKDLYKVTTCFKDIYGNRYDCSKNHFCKPHTICDNAIFVEVENSNYQNIYTEKYFSGILSGAFIHLEHDCSPWGETTVLVGNLKLGL